VQGGYGALFAVIIQILLSAGAIAVQVLSELRIYPRLQSWWRTMAQCRAVPRRSEAKAGVQFVSEPEISQDAGF